MSILRIQQIIIFILVLSFVMGSLMLPFAGSWDSGLETNFAHAVKTADDANSVATFKADPTCTGFWCEIGPTVGSLLLHTAASILWLGGEFLDIVVNEFVLQMGDYAGNGTTMGNQVAAAWIVIRDLSNIAFIFGFIYIGIMTILNIGTNTKRLLASLIIAALLVNFSLFFVRVIIDVANVFTVEIYNHMITNFGTGYDGIAEGFMNQMGLVKFYDEGPGSSEEFRASFGNQSFMFYVGATIFFLIAAYVFVAGAILLLIRFAALLLLMIFSPLLFAATVVPFAWSQTIARTLWALTFSYAFFAPAYLLLVYVSFLLIQGASNATSGNFAETLRDQDDFRTILNFMLIIIFMWMALIVANKMSVKGGHTAVNIGHGAARGIRRNTTYIVGGATAGLAARGLRSTAGRYSHGYLSDEARSKNLRGKAPTSWMARQKLKALEKAQAASFDARRVGKVGEKTGLGAGKVGGYKKVVEDAKKREEAFAKSLGEVGDKDEKVKGFVDTVDANKEDIRSLKDQISRASGDEKRALQGQLRAKEEELKDNELALKYERNRRRIGSAAYNAQMATMSDNERNELRNLYVELSAASDEGTKQTMRNTIKQRREEIKKRLESVPKDESERGYARTVQSWGKNTSGRAQSAIMLRTPHTNRVVGREMRKSYVKKYGRSKEDERFDKVAEAASKTETDNV